MRYFIIAALAVACFAMPAAAQDLPRYDVAAYCHKIASYGGSFSASTEQGCFRIEQEAYDEVKPVWQRIPASMRSYCRKIAEYGGGSYSTLQGCLRIELEAAAAPKTFRY